uniref:Uncharacterized protein n=1 Tax=Seriola dumerili TaxID=41447 RepID=A0A3B4UB93_SERDU
MKSLWNWGSMTCIMSNSLSGPLHVCRGGGDKKSNGEQGYRGKDLLPVSLQLLDII